MDTFHSLHKDLLRHLYARCCDMMATKRDSGRQPRPAFPELAVQKQNHSGSA